MKNLLSVESVYKSFASKVVLSGVSFALRPGELFTLLGPNGAGKTTLIDLCLGLRKLDKGNITIYGHSPNSLPAKKLYTTTPQDLDFPKNLSVLDLLHFMSQHYDHSYSVDECLDQFDLAKIANRQTGGLSGGEKRRLALALAFIGKPKLIFLDEPTTGLDINSRKSFWNKVANYIKQGGSIVLTTHYLEEAEKLSNRVGLLKDGQMIYTGDVQGLVNKVGFKKIEFYCEENLDLPKNMKYVKSENIYTIYEQNSDKLVRDLITSNKQITNLKIQSANLEQAFLLLTEKN